MQNKEFKVEEIPKWGCYLRGKWLDHFANHLTNEERKKIYLDSFLWHLCSYEKTVCLEKEAAVKAFERQNKRKCTVFYQFTNKAYLIQNAKNLKVKDLPYGKDGDYHYSDLYVMDWEHNWTFMITHENDSLGPYFIQRL